MIHKAPIVCTPSTWSATALVPPPLPASCLPFTASSASWIFAAIPSLPSLCASHLSSSWFPECYVKSLSPVLQPHTQTALPTERTQGKCNPGRSRGSGDTYGKNGMSLLSVGHNCHIHSRLKEKYDQWTMYPVYHRFCFCCCCFNDLGVCVCLGKSPTV